MDDRYQVKFDAINGQWITGDKMQKATKGKSTETKEPATTKVEKTKKKLKGLKGKIKFP